jgi:Alpha-L-arabinofuranosidase B (ABFB) domain
MPARPSNPPPARGSRSGRGPRLLRILRIRQRLWNHPAEFIRRYDFTAYIAADGGSPAWDAANLWSEDSSWLAATA